MKLKMKKNTHPGRIRILETSTGRLREDIMWRVSTAYSQWSRRKNDYVRQLVFWLAIHVWFAI